MGIAEEKIAEWARLAEFDRDEGLDGRELRELAREAVPALLAEREELITELREGEGAWDRGRDSGHEEGLRQAAVLADAWFVNRNLNDRFGYSSPGDAIRGALALDEAARKAAEEVGAPPR